MVDLDCLDGVAFVFFIITIGLLVVFFLMDVIAIPICLARFDCLSYRDFKGGPGEMNYCILYPEDDDMLFSFDKGKQNYKRTDSTAYLVPTPLEMYRTRIDVNEKFTDERYKNYHYLFRDDFVKGDIICEGSCTAYLVEVYNSCQKRWNQTIFNQTKLSLSGLIGKSRNKCQTHEIDTTLGSTDNGGTISFFQKVSTESPYYVYVKDGLYGSVTGTARYSVFHTIINVSNAIAKCNDYECNFGNLTGRNRTKAYVAVNIFSENIDGKYYMDGYYRPDKEFGRKFAVGVGIANSLVGLSFLLCVGFKIPRIIHDNCMDSSSDENKNENETKMDQPLEVITPGGTDAPAYTTPGGTETKPEEKKDSESSSSSGSASASESSSASSASKEDKPKEDKPKEDVPPAGTEAKPEEKKASESSSASGSASGSASSASKEDKPKEGKDIDPVPDYYSNGTLDIPMQSV